MHRSAPRTLLTSTLAAAVTAATLLAAPAAHAADARTGTVTGRATSNGTGVNRIVVTARTAAGEVLATTRTGAGGSYTLTGVPVGLRSICFDGTATTSSAAPLGYGFRCYGYADTAADATPVQVSATKPRTGVDQPLSQRLVITGTVVDPAGTPVAGATVRLYSAGGPVAVTAADGSYRLVDDANYPDRRPAIVDAPGLTSTAAPYGFLRTAGPYTAVAPGTETTFAPVVLDAAAAVAGLVTDRAGHALPGVGVSVYSSFTTVAAKAVTGADGRYRVVGLPADDLRVAFDPAGVTGGRARFGYLPQCWGGGATDSPVACSDTNDGPGDPVHTEPATLHDGVDAALYAAGAVSGVVRDRAGNPVAGAGVVVRPRGSTSYGASDVTAADGSWQVTGLDAGRYSVCSSGRYEQPPTSYGAACLGGGTDPRTSALVAVHLNAESASPDLTLPGPGTATGYGAISGRFLDAAGRPVSRLRVNWSQLADPDSEEATRDGIALTQPDGRFRIDNVPVSGYLLCVEADQDTRPADDVALAPICLPQAQVTDRATTDLATVTVPLGGRVSGLVTDALGYELDGWVMTLTDLDTGRITLGFADQGTGRYTSDPLVPGRYGVCVFNGDRVADRSGPPRGFATQCWRLQVQGSPTPVTVTSGATTAGVDFRKRVHRD